MTAPTSIIFMGTPDFAVPSLRALSEASDARNWQISAVVTQPDRAAGRSRKPVPSPIKQYALAHELLVLQPETLRKGDQPINSTVARLRELAPDVIVVAAYGLILPKSVLRIPPHGCLNVHASLLPHYRGASPIAAAILDGQTETGNTIMLMDAGMDTGPALAQAALPLRDDDTTPTLSARLAEQGAALLLETLPRWLDGQIEPTDQAALQEKTGRAPTTVSLIKKEDGRIDWSQPAARIERMTRAYTPWPSAFTTWNEGPFKIWEAATVAGQAEPGRVIETDAGPAVGTGEGLLLLRTVQPAGKRQMAARSFVHGAPAFVGSELG